MERLYAGLSFEQAVDKYIQTVYSVCVMRLSGNLLGLPYYFNK